MPKQPSLHKCTTNGFIIICASVITGISCCAALHVECRYGIFESGALRFVFFGGRSATAYVCFTLCLLVLSKMRFVYFCVYLNSVGDSGVLGRHLDLKS